MVSHRVTIRRELDEGNTHATSAARSIPHHAGGGWGSGRRRRCSQPSSWNCSLSSEIEAMTAVEVGERLGLHPRGTNDFLDTLVALGLLKREGEGASGRYRNKRRDLSLPRARRAPRISAGSSRWQTRGYTDSGGISPRPLQSGKPQNEIKHTGKAMFEELYSDAVQARAVDERDGRDLLWACSRSWRRSSISQSTRCSATWGGATGQLSMVVASSHPHMRCTSFDLPVVETNRPANDRSRRTQRARPGGGRRFLHRPTTRG